MQSKYVLTDWIKRFILFHFISLFLIYFSVVVSWSYSMTTGLLGMNSETFNNFEPTQNTMGWGVGFVHMLPVSSRCQSDRCEVMINTTAS